MGLIGTGVQIRVSTEVLNQKATEVSKEVEDMKREFDTIRQTVQASGSYWIGEAGDLHRRLFAEQSDDMDQIISRLREHPVDLQTIAGVYAAQEAEIQAMAGELPADVLF